MQQNAQMSVDHRTAVTARDRAVASGLDPDAIAVASSRLYWWGLALSLVPAVALVLAVFVGYPPLLDDFDPRGLAFLVLGAFMLSMLVPAWAAAAIARRSIVAGQYIASALRAVLLASCWVLGWYAAAGTRNTLAFLIGVLLIVQFFRVAVQAAPGRMLRRNRPAFDLVLAGVSGIPTWSTVLGGRMGALLADHLLLLVAEVAGLIAVWQQPWAALPLGVVALVAGLLQEWAMFIDRRALYLLWPAVFALAAVVAAIVV